MDFPKVIITKQQAIENPFSFETEVGLSTYDLTLISINKIIKKRAFAKGDDITTTYLI